MVLVILDIGDGVLLEPLPAGVTAIKLDWDLVGDGESLKPEDAVKEAVEALVYDESPSQYVGTIGDKIETTLTVKSAITVNGAFGPSTLHIMYDADQNVYVWSTTAKILITGATYMVKGTIKDHRLYQHTKQTILTRCRVTLVE